MKANSSNAPRVADVLQKIISMRLLICALFALHGAVLLALIIKTSPWLTGDSERYIALAASLVSGNGFGLGVGAAFEAEGMRMPGYPRLIAACQLLSSGVLGVVVFQCVLMLASVWMTWRVALKVFGETTGIIFLALSAVYPFVAYNAGQVSPEMPTVFLTIAIFFLLLKTTWTRFALAGAMVALAAYFRPNLLLLGIFLVPACVLADRRLWLKSLLMLVVSGLLVFPWAIRNYNAFGIFTPVTVHRGTGPSLFLASWQSKVSAPSLVEYGMRGHVTPELQQSGMLEQVRAINEQIGVPPETVIVTMEAFPNNRKALADQTLTRAAIANIKADPFTYLRGSVKNMARMWFSANLPESLPFIIRLGLVLEGALVFILGLIGITLAIIRTRVDKESRLIVFAAASAFLYFTLTLCWLHTEARYTIPARLLLLMLAAYGLKRLWELLRYNVCANS